MTFVTAPQKGFIALITAVLLSSVLLVVAATSSMLGFYARSAVLSTELKERSRQAAEACGAWGLVALASDQNYPGDEVRTLNELDQCQVGRVLAAGNTRTFAVQATTSGKVVTTLHIAYALTTQKVLSWDEVPN